MRLSTWKQQDYSARLAANPEEWAAIVRPLAGAGVDAFHLSQRRYWEGEFGTEANLATWTKKLTGKPTITVGSITLDNSVAEMMRARAACPKTTSPRCSQGWNAETLTLWRWKSANPPTPIGRIASETALLSSLQPQHVQTLV